MGGREGRGGRTGGIAKATAAPVAPAKAVKAAGATDARASGVGQERARAGVRPQRPGRWRRRRWWRTRKRRRRPVVVADRPAAGAPGPRLPAVQLLLRLRPPPRSSRHPHPHPLRRHTCGLAQRGFGAGPRRRETHCGGDTLTRAGRRQPSSSGTVPGTNALRAQQTQRALHDLHLCTHDNHLGAGMEEGWGRYIMSTTSKQIYFCLLLYLMA